MPGPKLGRLTEAKGVAKQLPKGALERLAELILTQSMQARILSRRSEAPSQLAIDLAVSVADTCDILIFGPNIHHIDLRRRKNEASLIVFNIRNELKSGTNRTIYVKVYFILKRNNLVDPDCEARFFKS